MRWLTECPDPAQWIARIDRLSVAADSGCIEWAGALDHSGYGRFAVRLNGGRVSTGAHRAAWLARRGDIPTGLVIDHLCRNRACVNVLHMELATNSVNALRADHTNKKGRSGRRRANTPQACGRHGREDGYLYTSRAGYVRWTCRICALENSRRHKAKSGTND